MSKKCLQGLQSLFPAFSNNSFMLFENLFQIFCNLLKVHVLYQQKQEIDVKYQCTFLIDLVYSLFNDKFYRMTRYSLSGAVLEETNAVEASSEKIKMFHFSDLSTVEETINTWLMENEVDIHHIGQSQSEKGGRFLFVVSLVYSQK